MTWTDSRSSFVGQMAKPFFRPFFKKWLSASKRNKMKLSRTKQAGSECTLSKPLFCPNYGESLKILSAPEAARSHGHHIYSVIFGGVFWQYWISGHKEGRVSFNCIGREGILTLAVQDWTKNRAIQELAKKIQKSLIK